MIHSRHTFLYTGRDTHIRLTKKRKAIIIAMARMNRTFCIKELQVVLNEDGWSIAQPTIARTLLVLVSNGLLIRYRGKKRAWVYEKSYDTANGSRLVCIVCGEMLEFGNEEIRLETQTVCQRYKFRVESVASNIFGVCMFCRYFKPGQN